MSRKVLLAVFSIGLLLVSTMSVASAHEGSHEEGVPDSLVSTPSELFVSAWTSTPTIVVGDLPWRLDGNSRRLNRTLSDIRWAVDQWNAVSGVNIKLEAPTSSNKRRDLTSNQGCRNAGAGEIFIAVGTESFGRETELSALAEPCVTSRHITRATIAINPVASNWHNGSGNPRSDRWDFRSVITHEIGHALGAGHYEDSPSNFWCNQGTANNATMCESTQRLQLRGQTWFRDLEFADRRAYQLSGN